MTMITEILLPKLGFDMSEGLLTEWLVADGETVKEGQPLYMLESEKSSNEIEAPSSGTLKIIAAPGGIYDVGTVLGVIE